MRHVRLLKLVAAFLIASLNGGCQAPTKATAVAIGAVEGKWLTISARNGVVPAGKWQTSDLTFDPWNRCLWAIADQNGDVTLAATKKAIGPGKHVFRISVPAASDDKATADAIEIRFSEGDFAQLKSILPADDWNPGLDYEGLVIDPTQQNKFYACTEGAIPLLMELKYNDALSPPVMEVTKVVRISTSGIYTPDSQFPDWQNCRWEGLTIDSSGKRLFLATERNLEDDEDKKKPRLYVLPVEDLSKLKSLKDVADSAVSPIELENVPSLGNVAISALQYLPDPSDLDHPGHLLALDRNNEKVLAINLPYRRRQPKVTLLNLVGPKGTTKVKMSPEGLAIGKSVDGEMQVWIINDPWSKEYGTQSAKFQALNPLLFQMKLKDVFPVDLK